MQKIATFIYKALRAIFIKIRLVVNEIITWIILYCNNIHFGKFRTNGIPYVSVARGGSCVIGDNLRINNGNLGNPIGRPQRCIFFVDRGASLTIGKNVGMSSTAIITHDRIDIGNNVKIGGGVCIYDTDFHSLDPIKRMNIKEDRSEINKRNVIIGNNVFIGAHSTILKGVTIGENSIIGACSVVTKNVPSNEIWGGNPARFIKNL